MASTVFKSWFINFDPVRAKAESREPEGMDSETAALFPDDFQDSAIGMIPRGWRCATFGELAEPHMHSVKPSLHPNTVFEHYSIPAYDSGQLPRLEPGAAIKSNKTVVPPGCVLQSKLNPHIPRIWLPGRVGSNAICSTEFLREYTRARGRGEPAVDAERALEILQEKMDVLRAMLHGCDYSNLRTDAMALVPKVANFVVQPEIGKERSADHVVAASKAFAVCCTLDGALQYRDELAFFQAVKAALFKQTGTERKLEDERKEAVLRQIIARAVVSDEVVDIFAAAGLSKPDISILSDELLEEVRQMKERNLAVELLQRLIKDEIKTRFKTNVVQSAKFSELLQQALARYRNRTIETAEVIEELIAMAKRFQEEAQRGERLRLGPEELAFDDALASNESAVRELGDEVLKQMAVELTQRLRNSVTVDWAKRETVRARLRVMVRTLLRRYKYPPDRQEAATNLVLKQAETLSQEWAESA